MDLLLGAFPVADVARDAFDGDELAEFIADRDEPLLGDDDVAIAGDPADLADSERHNAAAGDCAQLVPVARRDEAGGELRIGIELLGTAPDDLLDGRTDVLVSRNRFEAVAEDGVGGVGGEAAEALLAGAQRLLGAEAFPVLAGLGDGAAYGRGEAGEGALQDEVGGPVAERLDRGLLAERAGDEDEGDPGAELAFDRQRGVAVDAGEVEVGEDEIRRGGREGAPIGLGLVDMFDVRIEPVGGEHGADEFEGAEVVLEVDDAQGMGRARGHVTDAKARRSLLSSRGKGGPADR